MGKIIKRNDWRERLAITFMIYRSAEFIWGKTDCWCFASDCIRSQIGIDVMKNIRENYSSEKEAMDILKKDYKSSENFWTNNLGKPKGKDYLPKFGDICLVKMPTVKMLITGVVSSFDSVFVNGEKGKLISCSFDRIKYVWEL